MNLNKIRKKQLHSSDLHSWNYRGTMIPTDFNPINVLTGDNWVSIAISTAEVNGVTIYPGDMILALTDNPGALSLENGNWKLIRNMGVVGGVLIAESSFRVHNGNYNSVTKHLTIADFPLDFFRINDSVNIKVNSASYDYESFSVAYGTNEVVWKPNAGDAGFDLEENDYIEIEVFRN